MHAAIAHAMHAALAHAMHAALAHAMHAALARATHNAIHMVCGHLVNRLALTVSENERIIANYITDFHRLYHHL